jgi:hypothetical protein
MGDGTGAGGPAAVPAARPVGRVVSGGQTGADRAALDAARSAGLPYGGWCPSGGWAEDAVEPPGLLPAYPALREAPSADPELRTRWNVRDSDVTLVLHSHGLRSAGTLLTVRVAAELGRPCLVAAVEDLVTVRRWISALPTGTVLNVAGPRESEQPGLYAAARATLDVVLAGGVQGETVLDETVLDETVLDGLVSRESSAPGQLGRESP